MAKSPEYFEEKTIESNYIYRGRIINVRVDKVQMSNGNIASREVVEHTGAVSMVALTEQEEVILVRQYRRPLDKIILEIPAGKLDRVEDPLTCAKRELMEETGLTGENWENIAVFHTTPGFSNEIMYLYLVTNLQKTDAEPEEDEMIETVKIPLAKAIEMIDRKEIIDGKTIAGLLLAWYRTKKC